LQTYVKGSCPYEPRLRQLIWRIEVAGARYTQWWAIVTCAKTALTAVFRQHLSEAAQAA
jgi:hypothetical protein